MFRISALFYLKTLVFILLGRLIIRRFRGDWREITFTVLNVAVLYRFYFKDTEHSFWGVLVIYIGLALLQWLMLVWFGQKSGGKPWLAFFTPILALIVIRYTPLLFPHANFLTYLKIFVGISYLAFRCSHLVLEVRNGVSPRPTLWRYLGYCFFVPTMAVGPINPYSNYRRGFEDANLSIPIPRAVFRLMVGIVKYKFFGSILFQLGYVNLLWDDHYHHWMDLGVAVIFYYLFLYCNFSGFCDMAIGAAGLIGIPVVENFENPFAARNVKDFWNRWHISLSLYMRDVVFVPLSKSFVRIFGPSQINHAIALTTFVVFLLVGIWHGVGWNFAVFGLIHAIGVVGNFYYTNWLKKRLGREGFKAYNANPLIHSVAVILTFCYCAASLFFFANTFPEMKEIFAIMR